MKTETRRRKEGGKRELSITAGDFPNPDFSILPRYARSSLAGSIRLNAKLYPVGRGRAANIVDKKILNDNQFLTCVSALFYLDKEF
jgi:hypothetical protein